MLDTVAALLLSISGAPNADDAVEFSIANDVEALRVSLERSIQHKRAGRSVRVDVEPVRDRSAPHVFDLPLLSAWPGEVFREAGCAFVTIRITIDDRSISVTAQAPDAVRLYAGRKRVDPTRSYESFRKLAAMISVPEAPRDVIAAPAPGPKPSVFVEVEAPTWVETYLGPLGGVQASLTGGVATVSSRTLTSEGVGETVGSGEAHSAGYRVSLYKPPSETGLFYPPALGYFSQTITISGFAEDVASFEVPGTETIPAVATNPADGLAIDLREPIAYRLRLRSGYVGQTFGFHLVGALGPVGFFATGQVSLNVVELRHTDVTVDVNREEGFSVAFFGSANASAELGLVVEDLHFALVLSAQVEAFRDFAYPEPLEFLESAKFDDGKQIFERKRAFVEGAVVTTLDWQLSVVVLF